MIRRLLRGLVLLSPFAVSGAWLADRWLGDRRAGAPPEPIRTFVVVDAPIEATWSVLADVERQPEWMHDLKAVRLLTEGPARVGTRAIGTVRILGITVEDPVEIVEFEPPHRFAIRHEGLFTGGGILTLEPGADGTTTIVRWEELLLAPLLPHLAAVLQYPVFREVFQADLHRLAGLVEADAAEARTRGRASEG